MKTLAMPAPLPRLLRPPVAYHVVLLLASVGALIARGRPLSSFAPSDFDFSDLAADAPRWVAQLIECGD